MRLPIPISRLEHPRRALWLHSLIERSVAASTVEGGSAVAWCAASLGWMILRTDVWLQQIHKS